MKVEHGALEDELRLNQAVFHFHDQLISVAKKQCHDFVSPKNGLMLTTDKNSEKNTCPCLAGTGGMIQE